MSRVGQHVPPTTTTLKDEPRIAKPEISSRQFYYVESIFNGLYLIAHWQIDEPMKSNIVQPNVRMSESVCWKNFLLFSLLFAILVKSNEKREKLVSSGLLGQYISPIESLIVIFSRLWQIYCSQDLDLNALLYGIKSKPKPKPTHKRFLSQHPSPLLTRVELTKSETVLLSIFEYRLSMISMCFCPSFKCVPVNACYKITLNQ